MIRRPILGIGIAICLLALLWPSLPSAEAAAVGVSVSPSRFRLRRPPGEVADGLISIENNGTRAIRVTTEVGDMVTLRNKEGLSIREEAPAGTTPHSCARWIQVLEGEGVVIPPRESGSVKFVLSPPPEIASGGYGAYLFLIATPEETRGKKESDTPQARLMTVPRLGVSVIYEVAGAIQRSGNLTNLDFTPPTASDPMKVRYVFQNTGNAEVVLAGTFHILDAENVLIGKGSLQAVKTFPKEQGTAETIWTQRLPPGRYTVLLTFELGPDPQEAIVRELSFEVTR